MGERTRGGTAGAGRAGGGATSARAVVAPPASADEAGLWARWRRDGSADAREALADRYMPYARALAAKLYARRPNDGIDFDEYHQFAMVGLMEAIARYEPNSGAQFTTFATSRIRGAILNGLERLTEKQQQGAFRRRMAVERLASLTTDLAALEDPDRLLGELEAIGVGVALGLILEGTGVPLGPELVLPDNAYAQLELRQVHAQLWGLVERLDGRERDIIRMHYQEARRFDEIADLLSVSKGRISQLHRQAVARLRALISKAEACDVSY